MGSTGLLAIGLFLVGTVGVVAYQREQQQNWEALFFLSKFPPQTPNESAQELDKILISLDLVPALSQDTFERQDPDHAALWGELFDYVQRQAKQVSDPLDPIPPGIAAYLVAHDEKLAIAENHLLSEPPPRWGIDLGDFTHLEVPQPVFVGIVNLHRLLLLRSFMASEQGNQDQSERSLTAAWQLVQALGKRPDSLGQLTSTSQMNNQLVFLRHIKGVSQDWQQIIAHENSSSQMVRALQFDGWITYRRLQKKLSHTQDQDDPNPITTALPESYRRLSVVNMSEQLNQYYGSFQFKNPCEVDAESLEASTAWWNQLALSDMPRAVHQWQRSGETMLAAELTQIVLQAKSLAAEQGHWPPSLPDLRSSVCEGAHWIYQVAEDDKSLSITFQGPTTWRNRYNSGASLNFQASAWVAEDPQEVEADAPQELDIITPQQMEADVSPESDVSSETEVPQDLETGISEHIKVDSQ